MSEEMRIKISFDQSVSSGIIGFHGTFECDSIPPGVPTILRDMLQNQEGLFRQAGYRVASDIKPKEPKEK